MNSAQSLKPRPKKEHGQTSTSVSSQEEETCSQSCCDLYTFPAMCSGKKNENYRDTNTKGWPQKLLHHCRLSPTSTVLFTPTTPRSFGKDIRQTFLNLEECHDSFKWGLRAPLGSRSERRAKHPKVKLEVGNIF